MVIRVFEAIRIHVSTIKYRQQVVVLSLMLLLRTPIYSPLAFFA
jgi:hypothetical protein